MQCFAVLHTCISKGHIQCKRIIWIHLTSFRITVWAFWEQMICPCCKELYMIKFTFFIIVIIWLVYDYDICQVCRQNITWKPQGFQFSPNKCPSLVIGGGRNIRVRDMCCFPYGSLVVYPPDVLFQAFLARWKICHIYSTWWGHQHIALLVTQLTNLEITELVYTLKSRPSIQGTRETFELIEKLYWDVPWLSECSKHLNIPWHLRQLLQWLDFPLALKCTGWITTTERVYSQKGWAILLAIFLCHFTDIDQSLLVSCASIKQDGSVFHFECIMEKDEENIGVRTFDPEVPVSFTSSIFTIENNARICFFLSWLRVHLCQCEQFGHHHEKWVNWLSHHWW